MKRIIILIVILAAVGSGIFWLTKHGGDTKDAARPAADKAADDEGGGTKISRDESGRAVITMDDETQGNNGINVAKAEVAQWAPEIKGYGRVLDPTPLAAVVMELASARAAQAASSNELARLKILAAQTNASARALQTAEAAAARDELLVQSAKDRMALVWGKAITEQNDMPSFLKALTSLDTVLVRIDLPAGEIPTSSPTGARVISFSGNSIDAEYVGAAVNVDPLTQGRGYIFVIKTNATHLAPGEAVTGFIKIQGEPVAGVIVPRAAVVRTEGSGWVYILQGNAEDFVRTQIPLDKSTESGWFVTNGVTASNYVVISGAQMLLSEELKGPAKPD